MKSLLDVADKEKDFECLQKSWAILSTTIGESTKKIQSLCQAGILLSKQLKALPASNWEESKEDSFAKNIADRKLKMQTLDKNIQVLGKELEVAKSEIAVNTFKKAGFQKRKQIIDSISKIQEDCSTVDRIHHSLNDMQKLRQKIQSILEVENINRKVSRCGENHANFYIPALNASIRKWGSI